MSAIWVMAAADLGRAFQRHSRRGGTLNDVAWFVMFVLLAVAFFLVLYFWDRIKETVVGAGGNERTLFEELCRLHRLSETERSMLDKAIESASIAQPAYVFVDRSILARYAQRKGAPQKTCAALIQKLFGTEA